MSDRVLLQHLIITGALALALCLLFFSAANSEPAYAAEEDHKPNQVIVKLDTSVKTIEEFNNSYHSSTLDDYFANRGIYLVKPPDTLTELEFINKLTEESSQNGVVYAEANYVAEAPEDPAGDARMKARGISGTSESKEGSSDRAAAKSLRLSCAAKISQGKGATVAVLDTGAQLKHPALKTSFEGVKGYDFVGDDEYPSEPRIEGGLVGHGTHVTGIVARVAPGAKIMPLRVLNAKGIGDVFTIAKAVSYAQRHGADVINLSLGSSNSSRLLHEVIQTAIMKGAVVVAAAGNSGEEIPHYPAAGDGTTPTEYTPASPDGLIAVTSVVPSADGYDEKSWFANYGFWVDIAVPGQGIRSAFPIDKYANWSGTSMATPFISGQAALIHNRNRALEPGGIEAQIRNTARSFKLDLTDQATYGVNGVKLGAGQADVCESL